MEPLVSICIPCHNAERWLDRALASVFEQTWPRCEIILVDDGSIDNSVKVAEAYLDRGIRILSQSNRGQCAACNSALKHSQGEYIKFFDADDILSPDSISLQVKALQAQPGAIAYGEWARFHEKPDEALFVTRSGWHDANAIDWLVEIWSDGHPMMQCGQFLIPKCILDQAGGWDESLSLINDFEFFARLVLTAGNVVFTPGARLYYRSGLAGSLSDSRSHAAWESAYASFIKGTGHLLQARESDETRRACATMLQSLVYDMYPAATDLTAKLESRVRELGGCSLEPQGGSCFHLLRRFIGWKASRHLQILAGKFPRPSGN